MFGNFIVATVKRALLLSNQYYYHANSRCFKLASPHGIAHAAYSHVVSPAGSAALLGLLFSFSS